MTRLTLWPMHFSSTQREQHVVAWREGMRVVDLLPEEWRTRKGLRARVNSTKVASIEALVGPDDFVDVSIMPHGEPFSSAALVKALIAGLIGGAAGFLAGALNKDKGPRKRDDDESSNGITGLRNDRNMGQPRRIIVGEVLAAGTVADEFTQSTAVPPSTRVRQLLAYGEGPIESIGGIKTNTLDAEPLSSDDPALPLPKGLTIDGNDANDLRDVKAWVRLGTLDQNPIPGFNQTYVDYEHSFTLTQEETESANNTALNEFVDPNLVPWNADAGQPDPTTSANAQAVWDEHAVTGQITELADALTVIVSMPQGLWAQSGDGDVVDAGIQVQLRYRELDNLLDPILSGGDRGNGWVYPTPGDMLLARQQSAFDIPYEFPLLDPATYTPPVVGKCLDVHTNGTSAATGNLVAANLPPTWAPGNRPNAFTLEFWASFDSLLLSALSRRPLVSWWSGTNTAGDGFGFGLECASYDAGSGSPVLRWIPVAYAGHAGATTVMRERDSGSFPPAHSIAPTTTGVATPYHFFTFTYEKDPPDQPGVRARYRLYMNKDLLKQVVFGSSTQQLNAPTSASPLVLSSSSGTSNPWGAALSGRCFLDEVRVHDFAMTQAQITAAYNGGRGTYGVSASTLVMGYHFDVNGSPSLDFGPRGNNLTLAGGASAGTVEGHVYVPGVGTQKLSRWEWQALRLNLKSVSTRVADEAKINLSYGRVERTLAYPGTPLLGYDAQITDQLGSTSLTGLCPVRGFLAPHWDGNSIVSPKFEWKWTRNPFWVGLGIGTLKDHSRGAGYTLATADLAWFKAGADRADKLVSDGKQRLQEIDSTSGDILNLTYDATMFGGKGGIRCVFDAANGKRPPPHWVVGGFVGFRDVPTPTTNPGSVFQDVNIGTIDGFEIGAISIEFAPFTVDLIYDLTKYASPPWGGSGSLSIAVGSLSGATAEGRERLFEIDRDFDTFTNVDDVLTDILATARAVPVRMGSFLSVRFEAPRAPVTMVSRANTLVVVDEEKGTVRSTFRIRSEGWWDAPNEIHGEFLDRDHGYKNTPVRVLGDGIDEAASPSELVSEFPRFDGITRRSQCIRNGKFILRAKRKMHTHFSFEASMDLVGLEPNDVFVLAPDLLPWGVGGRVQSAPALNQIVLDHEVVVPASPSSFVMVRTSQAGQQSSGIAASDWMPTVQVTNAPGTYPAGSVLTLSSSFVIPPVKGDTYVFYREGEQMLAEVLELSQAEGMRRRFDCVNYDPSIHDVDELGTELPTSDLVFGGPPPLAQRINRDATPAAVEDLVAIEVFQPRAAGGRRVSASVSWRLDRRTVGAVSHVNVYVRAGSSWELRVVARGPATSARVSLSEAEIGSVVEIAVQPVGRSGRAVSPDASSRASVEVRALSLPPEKPTGFTASLNGDQVVYSWDQINDATVAYEIRRGGWILGQVAGSSVPGANSIGPTRNWASSDPAPPLLLRARDSRGQWSDAAMLEDFNPTPPGTPTDEVEWSNEWSPGEPWYDLGDPLGPFGSGLVRAQIPDGRWVLEFDGSFVSGTYRTALRTFTAARCYVEFYVQGDQVPPLTVDDWTLPFDAPESQRRTFEGALVVLPGEPRNCTVKLEIRYRDSASVQSEWVAYRPGIYDLSEVQFRATFTRQNDTFQMRVYRIHTRITEVA